MWTTKKHLEKTGDRGYDEESIFRDEQDLHKSKLRLKRRDDVLGVTISRMEIVLSRLTSDEIVKLFVDFKRNCGVFLV